MSVADMAARGITSRSVLAEIASGELGAWVADENGRIVGFSMARHSDGSIFALFTQPGFERRGHGSQLLATATTWLKERGHREAWLSTERGTVAETFYRKRGWTDVGPDGSDPRDIVFRKALA